jgi:hypothetical protein
MRQAGRRPATMRRARSDRLAASRRDFFNPVRDLAARADGAPQVRSLARALQTARDRCLTRMEKT